MNDLPLDQQILAAAIAYADARVSNVGVGQAMHNLRVLTDEVKENNEATE